MESATVVKPVSSGPVLPVNRVSEEKTDSLTSSSSSSSSSALLYSSSSLSGSSSVSSSSDVVKTIGGWLDELNFDNLTLRALPVDKEEKNFVRRVRGACFAIVDPTPVKDPQLVCYSPSALSLLDLSPDEITKRTEEFASYFSGNKVLPGARPAAHCYCGHQFGHFSGQLGDGATMYLGEIVNAKGERWELQFKGAGKTPFSRTADGRKVLRSSIREFLCSEAMYHLGIPTTRAGTLVTSDTQVMRDLFYTGDVINEKATVITRIAPTFLRFGSFEIFKPKDAITGREGPSVGLEDPILLTMLDHTIETYYPDILEQHKQSHRTTKYLALFAEVVRRTAELVAKWQCVGWCHGVLNTDNMSIVGLTIDYGPYGFMDHHNPDFICNNSDDQGRYTYRKQPEICRWNCMKLAEAIQFALPLKDSEAVLATFDDLYFDHYYELMRRKLGLLRQHIKSDKPNPKLAQPHVGEDNSDSDDESAEKPKDKTEAAPTTKDTADDPSDRALVDELFATMAETGADFTLTFRHLVQTDDRESSLDSDADGVLKSLVGIGSSVDHLKAAVTPLIPEQQLQMIIVMAQQNPQILMQLGAPPAMIINEINKMKRRKQLEKLKPCDKSANDSAAWQRWLRRYRIRLGYEVAGVSDGQLETIRAERIKVMNDVNPRFVLRNYIAQNAIEKADKGDYSEVHRVYSLLQDPYGALESTRATLQATKYDGVPPSASMKLRVT